MTYQKCKLNLKPELIINTKPNIALANDIRIKETKQLALLPAAAQSTVMYFTYRKDAFATYIMYFIYKN